MPISTVTQRTIELTVAVATDRIAGMKFKTIAERHGISVPMVRYMLQRAMKVGVASPEAIHFKPGKQQTRKSDDDYNTAWIRRVVNTIEVSSTGCWLWKSTIGTWGYGETSYRGKNISVHRQMYQVLPWCNARSLAARDAFLRYAGLLQSRASEVGDAGRQCARRGQQGSPSQCSQDPLQARTRVHARKHLSESNAEDDNALMPGVPEDTNGVASVRQVAA